MTLGDCLRFVLWSFILGLQFVWRVKGCVPLTLVFYPFPLFSSPQLHSPQNKPRLGRSPTCRRPFSPSRHSAHSRSLPRHPVPFAFFTTVRPSFSRGSQMARVVRATLNRSSSLPPASKRSSYGVYTPFILFLFRRQEGRDRSQPSRAH